MNFRFRMNRLAAGFAIALAVVVLSPHTRHALAAGDDMVTTTAKGSFEGTLTKLKKAITASKLVIVKEVPYSQMIGMVGVKAEKTVGLEIFHPRYGKVLYEKNKDAMIEAPLRMLVRDQGGEVMIRYRKPSVVFANYSSLSGLGQELDAVFDKIVTSVAK